MITSFQDVLNGILKNIEILSSAGKTNSEAIISLAQLCKKQQDEIDKLKQQIQKLS